MRKQEAFLENHRTFFHCFTPTTLSASLLFLFGEVGRLAGTKLMTIFGKEKIVGGNFSLSERRDRSIFQLNGRLRRTCATEN